MYGWHELKLNCSATHSVDPIPLISNFTEIGSTVSYHTKIKKFQPLKIQDILKFCKINCGSMKSALS